MTDVCLVYMTAGDGEEARRIAKTLVSERLAACANVLGPIRSHYRWQGEVQEDAEQVVIAKTRSSLVPALTERVRAIHSYDCPCVLSLPVSGGNGAFLNWIAAETRDV